MHWLTRMQRGQLLVILGCVLAMYGCGGDGDNDGGNGGGGGGESFSNVTPARLENQTFSFQDGRAFAAALSNVATTLTTGDFDNDNDNNPATGPYTLEAAAGTATGTLTVGSCLLRIDASSFPAGAFPELQGNQTLRLDPCRIGDTTGRLDATNAITGSTSTSAAPTGLPTQGVAFVLTTDFETGSYSVIELANQRVLRDINRGGVHSDAAARLFGGLIYVINRLGADSIQIIDPRQGYTTPRDAELSVGNGLNPHDIAFANANKAYVSRYASDALLVINPATLSHIGEIDLGRFTRAADTDRVPEMASLLIRNGLLYIALQHIDFNSPVFEKVAPGEIVVLDTATDAVLTSIVLNGRNPFASLEFSPALGRILVATAGEFTFDDGGLEAINPNTNQVERDFLLTEEAAGGDITHFQIVSSTKGYAIISGRDFSNALISFNPTTGQRLATLVGPLNVSLPHFAINSQGQLYLAVADPETPGIRIFDTAQDREITTTPLDVGLPPSSILFIE